MGVVNRQILFTVDVEEFDTALEYGHELSLNEQLIVSTRGLHLLADRLATLNVRATLFTTANYAFHETDLILKLVKTHEIASHGYYHTTFEPADLLKSRRTLEAITGQEVVGFRRARMGEVDEKDLWLAGYRYNSSLHPTYLPGRYNHLREPRTPFQRGGILHIPASVTPRLRLPLFWLSLKNFPFALYKRLCLHTLKTDGFLNLYVHPWEFTDLSDYRKIPAYVRRYSHQRLLDRVEDLLRFLAPHGEYRTMQEFADTFLSTSKA
ncbi:polysaccharide deacetylase family protein [Larkinella bovis]|uniref:Polysaccharide deacetylase family protein n=1 Tax=Larkinella bovis TaxID=683041 RepID=A0ABW0IB77_9BACT